MTTTHTESRANDLWTAFAGMFGAETLKRKYGAVPPREWLEVIARLKDYELTRGMRRLVASGSDLIPSLPKFRRLCQESLNDDLDGSQLVPLPRLPSNLLAQDAWEVAGSLHLRTYLGTRLAKAPKAFGPIVYGEGAGSAAQQACTAILVKWKKTWSQMMREEATEIGVESGYQREIWNSYMVLAEEEIIRDGALI